MNCQVSLEPSLALISHSTRVLGEYSHKSQASLKDPDDEVCGVWFVEEETLLIASTDSIQCVVSLPYDYFTSDLDCGCIASGTQP